MEHTNESEGHSHHIVTPRTYFIAYIALVVLMGLTIGAWKIDMGPLNNVVAMTIAIIKAMIVVLFFMQVKYSSRLTWLWAAIGFFWLFFLFGTVGDYVTRNWISVQGWQ